MLNKIKQLLCVHRYKTTLIWSTSQKREVKCIYCGKKRIISNEDWYRDKISKQEETNYYYEPSKCEQL